MSSNFATILMWANACFIVLLTMTAYQDAVRRNLTEARRHLQLAGLIALFSAIMSTVVLNEQKAEAATKATQNSSWNAYPQHTVAR